jgi:hypothetical protein
VHIIVGEGAHLWLTPLSATDVDETAVSDHEHPGSEGFLSPVEPMDVSCHLEESLGGQVLRLGGAATTEVPGHWTRQITV